MNLRKLSVTLVAITMLSIGFGNIISNNVHGEFIDDLSNVGLPANFVAYDTAWNEAGTMAVVVGYDAGGLETNAFAYWPSNDTYTPIDNAGYNQQRLHAADYFNQPIYDLPNVLLVDADWVEDGLINFYEDVFDNCQAYVDTWNVWEAAMVEDGKPTAADMADYDLVVWIPSRLMSGFDGAYDALNANDRAEISTYLDGGGNFFLSNIQFFNDYDNMLDFCNNYLGIGSVYNYFSSRGYCTQPIMDDDVFGDLPIYYQDWNECNWGGSIPGGIDIFRAGLGTICIESADSGMSWEDTGIRYDSGTFKTMFFSNPPLETLSLEYASDLMNMALDWMVPSSVPDQTNDYFDNSDDYNVGIGTTDPWAQCFVPDGDSISKVEFYMYKNSAAPDYFHIEICEDIGSEPSPTNVTHGWILSSDIPVSSSEWVECVFEDGGGSLTPGNTYWIVCTRLDYTATSHYWTVDLDLSYAPGDAMEYSGTWNFASYDWYFRTYPASGGESGSNTINPVKDTTLYEEFYTQGNGAGEYLLAGYNYGSYKLRSLMEFDLTSIPKYSIIDSVSLSLYCSNVLESTGYDVHVCPVETEWSVAGSDAPDMEDEGTTAEMGDATWDYTNYDTEWWSGPGGGDYSTVSASTSVFDSDITYTWSSSAMVDDVQTWLDTPYVNNGWLLQGDEGMMGSVKWFNSMDNSDETTWPILSISYTEPEVIGYEDVFWIAGDTFGVTPPGTAYKVLPSEGLSLIPMADAMMYPQFFSIAVDDMGNPLCAGNSQSYMYYYDGFDWMTIDSPTDLTMYSFEGLDFNPNDRRFYATGMDFVFYTDTVPLIGGTSQCFLFNYFPDYGGSMDGQLAWNELYDYGIFGGDMYLVKIWPYGEYGNGTVRYELISSDSSNHFYDVSWDTDGWNELGIVGGRSGQPTYWRYYDSNPQLLDGYMAAMAGTYYAGAMKPPSSPKWLFIPSAGGSVRVNIEEVDESAELSMGVDQPHIFTVDMWKQSDAGHVSVIHTSLDVDTTYTFLVGANFTVGGVDHWSDLQIDLTAWYDGGINVGPASAPGDPTWTDNNFRTRQFNVSFDVGAGTIAQVYPITPELEFGLESYWIDPITYGVDGSVNRVYFNITFGKLTTVASSDLLIGPSATPWDVNSLLNADSWDLRVMAYDIGTPSTKNISYKEFGINQYAAISIVGNPGGSAPPGTTDYAISTPSQIYHSTNSAYTLNVSVPNLYKDGNEASPYWIWATNVKIQNTHSDADMTNSEISSIPTVFTGPDTDLHIWWSSGSPMDSTNHGSETAGPVYSDYTAWPAFEVTELYWWVTVQAGLPEGNYRGTIKITLWGG